MDSCTRIIDSMDSNMDSMRMSYELLKTITDDFSDDRLLGRGTFGNVYKGILTNGEEIAVKVLNDIAALDDKNFTNEFRSLARLKHKNIVQLVGYCNESSKQLFERDDGTKVPVEKMHVALCFECIGNGSLDKYISDEHQGYEWHIRYKIIKGICEGLKHLREGLEAPVWHLDLKPGNVLIDDEMVPKIADFGLARFIGEERTKNTLSSVGTVGYLPPEFVRFQMISEGFDLFSLGVIITKIMIGGKGYNSFADMPPRKLINQVHNNWKERLRKTLRAGLLEGYCQQVKKCIVMALKCLHGDRKLRPSIQDIVDALNETETIMPLQFHEGQSMIPSDTTFALISSSERDGEASRPTMIPRRLPYKLLEGITAGFSEDRIIDRRSYGIVYKGVYEDGQVIAVQVLDHFHPVDESTFEMELENLAKAQHENIAQFVGYCNEDKQLIIEHKGRNILAMKLSRVLCFEYYPNGSLDRYLLEDAGCGLDWRTCYKIMKGTCDGLRHLHEGLPVPILHLDLKPNNILLDENMTPKITDFSSVLLDNQRTIKTFSEMGQIGYMPPEFMDYQILSTAYDMYSLGVIMLRTIAGNRGYYLVRDGDHSSQEIIELLFRKWRERLQATYKTRSVDGYCQQLKRCIEIALRCIEKDRHKRPRIGDIVRALEETESWIHYDCELLDVHPMELRFPFKPKKHGSCLLQLHNKQEDHVAFRLVSESPAKYLSELPLCGIVPPGCTYTLALTTCKLLSRPPSSDSDEGFVLQSIAVSNRSYLHQAFENLFKNVQETAEDEMQELTLKSFCAPPQAEEASSKLTQPEIEIITARDARQVSYIEVHPTKPWIMTTHQDGNLRVWDYQKMEILIPIEVPEESVYVAKFSARDDWIVAGDGDGYIHVLSYNESQDSTSFRAHDGQIMSLAIHPTDTYVLSSSHGDHLIKLWQWDDYCWNFEEGPWECTRTFDGHSDKIPQVVFNPEEPGKFASASWDGTVKIWDIKTDSCITKTFEKHPDGLLCLDYTDADRLHLIVGSKDGTVQVWNMETNRCKDYLQGHARQISVVSCHPELQKLITASLDGTVRIWDSTTFRIENIIAFNLGAVSAVGYIEKLRRIVVACEQGIATMEIKLL